MRVIAWSLAIGGLALFVYAWSTKAPVNESGYVPEVALALMLATAAVFLLEVPKSLRENGAQRAIELATLAFGATLSLGGAFLMVWGPPLPDVLDFFAWIGLRFTMLIPALYFIVQPLLLLMARLVDRVPFLRRHGGGAAFLGRRK